MKQKSFLSYLLIYFAHIWDFNSAHLGYIYIHETSRGNMIQCKITHTNVPWICYFFFFQAQRLAGCFNFSFHFY